MSRMLEIAPETIELARKLKASGSSWNHIGRETGVDRDVIRCRLDADFARRNRVNPDAMGTYFKPTDADLRRMQDAIPRDTRSPQAKMMGDPLPGRSALDRKHMVNNTSVDKCRLIAQSAAPREHIEDRPTNEAVV